MQTEENALEIALALAASEPAHRAGVLSSLARLHLASLSTLLAKQSNVKAAYLALMLDKSTNEKPHLIVGIEADGDYENVLHEAGTVAADMAPEGEPVNFLRVTRGDRGVGQYLIEEVKSFYERDEG